MSKKKTKTETSKMSLQEFKSWLKGIMEFQDDSWTPRPEQWRSIVDKIMDLEDYQQPTSQIPATNYKVTGGVVPQPAQSSQSKFASLPKSDEHHTTTVDVSNAPRIDMSKSVPFAVPLGNPEKPAQAMHIDSSKGYKSDLI